MKISTRGFVISKIKSICQNHLFATAILFISLATRWILIFRGGQYFFPDEIKYDYSKNIVDSILQQNFTKAFADLTVTAGNFGYRAIGVIPATLENIFLLPPVLPALFFSIFSILNIYLIWKISLRIGLSERESYLALLIAASSHTLIYYVRHLLPYDLALFFGLLALYKGLNPNATKITYLASGAYSLLCFISYTGYWPLASFAIVAPIIISTNNKIRFLYKVTLAIVGFLLSSILFSILLSIGST